MLQPRTEPCSTGLRGPAAICIQSTTVILLLLKIMFLLIGEERQPVGGVAVDEDGLPDRELEDAKQRVEHVVHDLAQLVPPAFDNCSTELVGWVACLE